MIMTQRKEIIWRKENKQVTANLLYILDADIATITFNIRTPLIDCHYWLPMGIDYHADNPKYAEQTKIPCIHRKQGFCYADGTSLGAQELWDDFINSALREELIWEKLKNWMTSQFPEAK